MICYVTGIPGSGKTALSVNHIINNKDNDKYTQIYTNINQFDFSKVDKAKNLDWDFIYQGLTELHALYKQKVNDDELIEYAKQYGLYQVLIVLDECHNFLDKKDSVLVWWLSYHRHLNQDIYLITQNLSLVESKYKAFAEIFYRASPSFLRFRHHILKYTKFIDSRMTKTSKFGVEKIDTKKNNVFAYYKSGDDSKGGNIIAKYLLIASFFFGLAIFIFKVYFSSDAPKHEDDNTTSTAQTIINNFDKKIKKDVKQYDYENYTYLTFSCIGKECKLNDKYFDIEIIPALAQTTQSTFFPLKVDKSTNLIKGAVLSSPLLQNMFRSFNDETNSKNSNSSSLDLPFTKRN